MWEGVVGGDSSSNVRKEDVGGRCWGDMYRRPEEMEDDEPSSSNEYWRQ